MQTLSFTIEGNAGRRTWPIVGDVHLPTCDASPAPNPVVALAHGWLGCKDRGAVPGLARALAEAGIIAVSFNFSGSGVPAGAQDIADLDERFAANTFGREVEDVERVVTAIFERMLPGCERFDIYRIGVAGEGAGGAVALIEAAGDSRVKALATVGAPATLAGVVPKEAWDDWIARGEHRFRDPRTGRPLALEGGFFRDLRARTSAAADAAAPGDALPAARALATPRLFDHVAAGIGPAAEGGAKAPETVSASTLEDARKLYFVSGDVRSELEIVAGAELAPAAATRFFQTRLR